uniref:Uncharacterized protein n=1 Tax=Rhizophora mucronata TaxID=61149 RepID=A0A2P2QUF0_RHIMU
MLHPPPSPTRRKKKKSDFVTENNLLILSIDLSIKNLNTELNSISKSILI